MLKPRHFFLPLLLLISGITAAQETFTKSEQKTIAKSGKYAEKGDYDKAITSLRKVMPNHQYNDNLWSWMVNYQLMRYDAQQKKETEEMTKALLKALQKGDKNIKLDLGNQLSHIYYTDFITQCQLATLKSSQQEMASIYLRTQYVDEPVDTALKDGAKEKFDEAEKYFARKDYSEAIRLYSEALKIDSSYYKASLYIGDSYWGDNQPARAAEYFIKAIQKRPDLLEPRKYLVDAYQRLNKWDDAYRECIDAIALYPDVGMFLKLESICRKRGKKFDRHWMVRDYFPNKPGRDQDPIPSDPWKLYREAKNKIAAYFDENGVITKDNDLTKQKYMEAYCWEYMLSNSTDNSGEFEFARKMMKEGYLDCYAFVSMYHVSNHKQFAEFSKNNKQRIYDYVNTHLVK